MIRLTKLQANELANKMMCNGIFNKDKDTIHRVITKNQIRKKRGKLKWVQIRLPGK